MDLVSEILSEPEFRPRPRPAQAPDPNPDRRMGEIYAKAEAAITLITETAKRISPDRRPVLAFSGGADSVAVLDLTARAGVKPLLIHADTGMEYPETLPFCLEVARAYGLELRVARPPRTPLEQWHRTGWPFLGKMAARLFNQAHPDAGFKLNCSECCLELKIRPARNLTKNIGARLQITGQKGNSDDQARGMRSLKDGPLFYQKAHGIWILNPLTGWTDQDVQAYSQDRKLPRHPARDRGALTIGCLFCGGGSQFENSGLKVLRNLEPDRWRTFIVEWGAGAIILAIKHRARLQEIIAALNEIARIAGIGDHYQAGLGWLAQNRPWVFDFTRKTPKAGYKR